MNVVAEIIGLIGVFFILVTYLLAQSSKISVDDWTFLIGNVFGSLCVIFSLLYQWNLAAFIVEFFWTAITLFGVYRKINNPRKSTTSPT